MRRIDMSKDKVAREFIKPQEIVELSPDRTSEGKLYIGIHDNFDPCGKCDLNDATVAECPMVRSVCGFKLCVNYMVYLKRLDKIMEDL